MPFASSVIGILLLREGSQKLESFQAEEAALVLPLGPGELEALTEQDLSLQHVLEQAQRGVQVGKQGPQFTEDPLLLPRG